MKRKPPISMRAAPSAQAATIKVITPGGVVMTVGAGISMATIALLKKRILRRIRARGARPTSGR